MNLKNLITNDKVIEVEHPFLEGFKVSVGYISREKTKKLLDKATTTKFNKKTHQPEEDIDNDLFMKMYTKELIKDWTGLKYSYLAELLPVDLTVIEDDNEELEYSEENAIDLMKGSTDFDTWLSSVIGDVRNFNKSS